MVEIKPMKNDPGQFGWMQVLRKRRKQLLSRILHPIRICKTPGHAARAGSLSAPSHGRTGAAPKTGPRAGSRGIT